VSDSDPCCLLEDTLSSCFVGINLMMMSDFKAHLWKGYRADPGGGMCRHWVVCKRFFFQRKWSHCAGMCLSGGLCECRRGCLYLSHEYFHQRAERPQYRKHIRQASPKSHHPSLLFPSLSFL